jgi:hypothetical protein
MKWLLRGLLLTVCLLWLLFGLVGERHEVHRLDTGEAAEVSGPQFVKDITTDSYLLKDGKLFAVNSLLPQGAGAKDCKT